MRKYRSFATRLSGRMILVTFCLYFIAIVIIAYVTFLSIREEASSNATHVLDATAVRVDKILGEVETAIHSSYWQAMENINDTDQLYHISYQVVKTHSNIIGCAIALDSSFSGQLFLSPFSYVDKNEEIYSKGLGNAKYNYYYMDWYSVPFHSEKATWCKPYYDEGGSMWLMTTYGFPLKDPKGKVIGIMTADLSLKGLSEMTAKVKPYPNAYTLLIDKDGNVISDGRTTIRKDAEEVSSDKINEKLESEMRTGKTGTMSYREDGQHFFVAYCPISNGWSMALVCPYTEIFAHTIKMNNVFVIVSLFAMLLTFIICVKLIRKDIEPVTQLSVSALNMAKGKFDANLPDIHTEDEMRKLHDSMAYMQKSITSYISELRTTTASNERMESELNIARKIQMGMVPRVFPDGLFAHLSPAKEVGGDLYDFTRKDDKLFFAIGDVSGKGVPAALIMAFAITTFRCMLESKRSIEGIVTKINDSLAGGNENNMFVTFFAGCLDVNTGKMRFCNAGHNPILIIPPVHTQKKPYLLHAKANIAVGVFAGFPYEAEELNIEKDSTIILYTDGVTEAENVTKEQYGETRLLTWAESVCKINMSPEELVNDLVENVHNFTLTEEQNDDITIFGIRV